MPRRHAACVALVALLAACASPAPQPDGASRTEEVAPRFAAGGPNAEEYGASNGYPTGDRTTFFRVPSLVGSHSHLDEVFEGRLIRKAPAPSRLVRVGIQPSNDPGNREAAALWQAVVRQLGG